MVFLVALIPLFAGGLIVLLRDRPPRVRWAASVGFGVLHLLLLVVLLRTIPLDGELTTWAPTSLFHGKVLLTLDSAGWILVASGSAVITSHFLLSAGEAHSLDWSETVSGFAYMGLSIAAFLAGNLLTVALAWAAVDVLAHVYLLGRAPDLERVDAFSTRFLLRGASTLVVVAGGIPEAAGGGGPVTEALEVSVLSLAVWLRCGMWPIRPAERSTAGIGLVGTLDESFPAAMAFAALAQALGGNPTAGLAWIWFLIGGVNALFGGLRWNLSPARPHDPGSSRGLSIAVGGLALLTVVLPRAPGGLDFAWWGAVTLVIASIEAWPRLGRRMERVLLGLLTLLLIAGPGWVLGRSLTGPGQEFGALEWASGFLILLGTLTVAWGTWRRSPGGDGDGQRGEVFAQGATLLGSLLPPAVLIAGLALFGYLPSWAGGVWIAAGVAGFVILEAAGNRLDSSLGRDRLARAWEAFVRVAGRTVYGAGRIAGAGEAVVKAAGRVLEGSAALLWMLVVVLVVGLLAAGG